MNSKNKIQISANNQEIEHIPQNNISNFEREKWNIEKHAWWKLIHLVTFVTSLKSQHYQ